MPSTACKTALIWVPVGVGVAEVVEVDLVLVVDGLGVLLVVDLLEVEELELLLLLELTWMKTCEVVFSLVLVLDGVVEVVSGGGGGGGGVQVVVGVYEVVGSGVQVDVGVGVGVGLGLGVVEVVWSSPPFPPPLPPPLPSLKCQEPVRTPTDGSAKKLKRPVDMSRPPYGHPGHSSVI